MLGVVRDEGNGMGFDRHKALEAFVLAREHLKEPIL